MFDRDPLRDVLTAGALTLALGAGACAGANKPKTTVAAQPRTYAIGPVGPGLAAGDPGELTRWQNQMAREMRAGRPAPAVRARPAGPPARAALAEGRGASGTPGAVRTASSPSGSSGLTSVEAPAPGGVAPQGAGAAVTAAGPTPVLTRATLGGPAVRAAAAASEATGSPAAVRWLWALAAACVAALLFIVGRAVLTRVRRRPEEDMHIAPGPARVERSPRTPYKPGPPPPRVTVLASARR
jgi:hypothetical protein